MAIADRTFQGQLSICRVHPGNRIAIELEDETSGIRCVVIEMEPEALMIALTGLSNQPCQFTLAPDRVGLYLEHQEVRMFFDRKQLDWDGTDEEKAQAAAETQAPEGWTPRWRDLLNWHRHEEGNWFRVQCYRFVDRDGIYTDDST